MSFANFQNDLFLPLAGTRSYSDALLYYRGADGYYWSSSPSGMYTYYPFFDPSILLPQIYDNRAYGFSLRCFKDSSSITLCDTGYTHLSGWDELEGSPYFREYCVETNQTDLCEIENGYGEKKSEDG